MPSILVTVFVLQLVIHLINTIGVSTVNVLLWHIYNRLPTPTSKAVADQRHLQKEFLQLRKDLNATSSQDEFAKWAKLRRQHDKVLQQLEKSKSSLDSAKLSFETSVSTLRWIGTNGLRFFLQWWYAKEPMFWLPHGWVPYYAEWLLSFPRAPLGSISIQAWVVACGVVILLVSDVITAIVKVAMEVGTKSLVRDNGQPSKFSGEEPTSEKVSAPGDRSKKEL